MTTNALAKYETPEQGLAIIEQRFGAFSKDEGRAYAMALIEAGFNPNLRHIVVYQGQPWVTIDGWAAAVGRLCTKRAIAIPRERSKPIPRSENDLYGAAEDDLVVWAWLEDAGHDVLFEAQGKASRRAYTYDAAAARRAYDSKNQEEIRRWREHPDRLRNPLEETHTYDMAEKRALAKCWRRFWNSYFQDIPAPDIYEGDPRAIEGQTLDTMTGEITGTTAGAHPAVAGPPVAEGAASVPAPAAPEISEITDKLWTEGSNEEENHPNATTALTVSTKGAFRSFAATLGLATERALLAAMQFGDMRALDATYGGDWQAAAVWLEKKMRGATA